MMTEIGKWLDTKNPKWNLCGCESHAISCERVSQARELNVSGA